MLNSDNIPRLVQNYPFFEDLPPTLLRAVINSCYAVHADPGEVLFDAGSPGQSFLMLLDGSVRVIQQVKDRELLLYRMQPGDCCILTVLHLLTNIRYPARVQAESVITGIALPQHLFKQMVEESSVFNAFILQSFAVQFTELLELLERIVSLRLDQRLARLLLSKGDVIQATHAQLADELGSVREVISRILKDFEGKGMIRLERGLICILDRESLENLYHSGD
jgi:CRP/FNR family transcriptional regulator